MSVIFKYPLRNFSEDIEMPIGARILSAQMQDGRVTLWALAELDGRTEVRKIRVFGTGHEMPAGLSYIGTTQDGLYVWHVFEEA